MPRNGSGTYSLPTGQPVATGTTISSTVFNALTADLAAALTTSVAKDGQTAMTANLPMGGNKLTGLAAGTGAGESVRYEQLTDIQNQTYTAFETAGTSTAYTLTPAPVISAYAGYQSFFVDFHVACGASPTININGLGAIQLVKQAADGTYVGFLAGEITFRHLSRVTLLSNAVQALVERPPFRARVIDSAYAEYTSNADITTTIPLDDTIPQNTEGTQILSASITPKSTTSRLRISFKGQVVCGTLSNIIAALFSGAGADAIKSTWITLSASFAGPIELVHEYVPGVTTSLTFTVRVATSAGLTMRLNGSESARKLGGSSAATLVIEEIAV